MRGKACVRSFGAMVLAAAAGIPAAAQLVNTDWNKDNGDFLWMTAGNWTNGVPNGANASARFKNAITQARTVTIANAGVDVGQLVFDTDDKKKSYTIAGGPLTFKNATQNRILADATNLASHTISANIKVDVKDLILESALAANNSNAEAVALTLTGGLFELNNTARALRVRGKAYFRLDTESNFLTGGTFIEQGRLQVKSDKSLGNGNKDVSIISGELSVDDKFTTTRKIAVGAANGSGASTLTNNGAATFNGVISGSGGLALFGAANGLTKLTGVNTFTGDVSVFGTQVEIDNEKNLGKGTEPVTLLFSTLKVNNDTKLARTLRVYGDSLIDVPNKKSVSVDQLNGFGAQNGDILSKKGAGSLVVGGKTTTPLTAISLDEGELDIAGTVLLTGGIVANVNNPKATQIAGGGAIQGQVFTAPQTKMKPKKGDKESVEWHLDQTGDLSIVGDTSFDMGITLAAGTAGQTMGWGVWNLTGNLLLSNTASSPMTVELASLDSADNPYYVLDFDPAQAYSWKFIAVSGGSISGFDAGAFVVDASAFWNLTYGGTFGVSMLSDGLYVNFTPSPTPGAAGLLGLAGVMGLRRRR